MKFICLAYFIATLVPNVPIANHILTAIKLNIARIIGFTCATAPCDAKIKFSIFPNIINPKNGMYCYNIINSAS